MAEPTAEASSTNVSDQSKLSVQQCGSLTTENDKVVAGTGVNDDVGGDADPGTTASSAEDDEQKELDGESEVKNNEIDAGALHEDSQHPEFIRFLLPNPVLEAHDLARTAACASRSAASPCRTIKDELKDVINSGQEVMEEICLRSKEISSLDEANRLLDLAKKYDAVLKLATIRVRQLERAAESAENASMEAEVAAKQLTSDEALIDEDEKVKTAYQAANNANTAVIKANKMQYVGLCSLQRCLKDLDPGMVESELYPTRNQNEDLACSRNRLGKALICYYTTAFIVGILSLAASLFYLKDEEYSLAYNFFVAIGTILTTITPLFMLYKMRVHFMNAVRRFILRCRLCQYIPRLRHLKDYFDENNIFPDYSDFDSKGEDPVGFEPAA